MKQFIGFLLWLWRIWHNRRRMTQGAVTRRPCNGPGFRNGDGNGTPDDSTHASTLAGGAAKHKPFLDKNFTKNPQTFSDLSTVIEPKDLCTRCQDCRVHFKLGAKGDCHWRSGRA
jgi:hypothetical protein